MLDAEAGGERQRERAEREWARETRDRIDHEVRDQAAARAATVPESTSTKTSIEARGLVTQSPTGDAAKDLETRKFTATVAEGGTVAPLSLGVVNR
jgi:hypothetical protein